MADGGAKKEVQAVDEEMADDYRVGHCRPPLATRFQKGKSGNPSGRPKGSKNTRTLLQEKLAEKVKVRSPDGRTRKLSKREIGITKMANRFAETGDLKTFELLMKLEGTAIGQGDAACDLAPRDEDLSAADKVALDWYLDMRASSETEVD